MNKDEKQKKGAPRQYTLKVTVLEGNDYAPRWEELGRDTVTVGEDQTLPDQPQYTEEAKEKPNGNDLHDPDQRGV